MKNKIKLRIILWLILAMAVGFLLYMAVVPGGQISYVYDFKKPSKFIEKLTPKDRVEPVLAGSQKIIGDPVYFSLYAPRRFNEALVTLKYKGSEDISLIELGVLADKTIWRYELKPVENKIIDKIALVWERLEQDGKVLLQKEKKFDTLEEFLNNLPPREEIALYNIDFRADYVLSDYAKGSDEQVIDNAMRGPYQFYTYLKDEDLDFQFSFFDINKNKDSDPIDLYLYYDSQLIDSRHLEDDGISTDSGENKGERKVDFKLVNLPEGVYKIELRSGDDVITNSIKTKQNKLSFLNKIWFYKKGRTDIKIYTDSREIHAQTINPDSRQIIKIREKDLAVNETYRQFSAKLDLATTTEIILAKDGLILAGDGVFSFSKGGLINPNFKKVTPNLDISKEGINYVLAKYKSPSESEGWKTAQIEFDLTNTYREKNKYNFLISVPGLKADDEKDDWIIIKEIRVKLTGKSLWQKIFKTRNP